MSKDELDKLFNKALEKKPSLKKSSTFNEELIKEQSAAVEGDNENLYKLINDMTMPQKLKLAMLGNKSARSILIRDSNTQISQAVLGNNRLTETEVIEFSRNTNLDDSIFRIIARNGTWLKLYDIKYNLVANPKVPVDISLQLIKHLHAKDLEKLAKSKNVPQVIASQCRKLSQRRKQK